jgi:hypothetical protein
MAKAGKSAFVSNLAKNKKVLAASSKTVRTVLIDDAEIIENYDLRAGDRKTFRVKLVSATCGVHEDGKYEGLPYVNFMYSIQANGPLKGGCVGNYIPGFDRKTLEVTEKAMEWIYRELQGFGYDTSSWGDDPEAIEDAIKELSRDKPSCILLVAVNEIKSGPRQGSLAVNKSLQRVIDSDDVEDDAEEAEEAPAPKKPAGKPAPAPKQAAKKVEPEVEPEEESEVEAEDDNTESEGAEIAKGDKVKFTFVDEENETEEEVEGTVEKINEDGTYKVNDGTYFYDVDAEDIIEAWTE